MARVRVDQGMAGRNYRVVDGCLLSLSLCRRDFQDLLKVRLLPNLPHNMTVVNLSFHHNRKGKVFATK
jgi:hypothetical protein